MWLRSRPQRYRAFYVLNDLSQCINKIEHVCSSTLWCHLSGWVLEQVKVQLVQGDRRRGWRGLGQLEEPLSSDTTARVWGRYKDMDKKRRKWHRHKVKIIYRIDGRCRPPLITAGMPMISPKIESRWGQGLRQTKDVHSGGNKEKSPRVQF